MTKSRAGWQITDEGREALSKYRDPVDLAVESSAAYRRRKADQPSEIDAEEIVDTSDDDRGSVTIEEAEEIAWGEIEAHLRAMPPYDFQDLVGALLKAMGYHVPWTAPRGKDGGVDIIAYTDPLGAVGPRIKVQVKRHNAGSIGAADLRSFLAVLGQQAPGIFVATNGFTNDAQNEARAQESRRIMLIDLKGLVALWTEHYSKLDDEAQAMFPIRPVYFLHC